MARTFGPAAALWLAASACGDDDGGPTCATNTCSGHGTCSVEGGELVCTCDPGYAGEFCDTCADGWQDADGDGDCEQQCGTSGLVCGDHAHCEDASGEAVCVCDDGYQDHDGDGDCAADCATAALDCSGHGTCDDASGTALCNCDAGYQDHDANGTCEPDCGTAGLDCGDRGSCDDATGRATCVCEEGYDRSDCGVCESAYYQDHDGDGVCTPTCYFSAPTFRCGDHEVCSHASGGLECVCDDGFQDHDRNGSCLPTCRTAQQDDDAPLVCPDPNGVCDDSDGSAGCRCRLGFADDPAVAGADCRGCAAGYQDHDADGTCVADCAAAVTAGLLCTLGCDDATGAARCICAEGEQDHDADGTCEPDCAHAGLTCDPAEHRVCDDADGLAACVCTAGTYDDGMGTCRTIGSSDGDDCAVEFDLDLSAPVLYADMTAAGTDHAFGCDSMGLPFRDLYYRLHLAAGETRRLRFTVERTDATGATFTPAVAVLAGPSCATAAELACATGFDPVTFARTNASVEVSLEGGPSGAEFHLVVGLYDRRGRASRAVVRLEHVCGPGSIHSALLDACVDDPCGPANPCTAPHRSRCVADVSSALPTYACACDIGTYEDTGACVPNASDDGDGCADVTPLTLGTGAGSVRGSTADAVDDGEGSCRGDRPARDRVYGFALNQETRVALRLSVDPLYDALLHLRTACDDAGSEVLCVDVGPEGGAEEALVTLGPGTYYLFVDGWNSRDDDAMSDGDYTLEYSFYPNPCADEAAACPGEPVCTPADDWSAFVCACGTEGEVLHAGSCVDDPCVPDPCSGGAHEVCRADLGAGTSACVCGGSYVPDGSGGCRLDPDAEWTVLWYMAMDNNLFYQSAHELEDVMAAALSPDVRVVALVDRYDEARGYYGEFGPGRLDRIVELGDPDTGSWETLRDFGLWAVENYPARHHALVLSDHGGAWRSAGPGAAGTPPALRAICWDDDSDTPEDGIGIADGDLAAALGPIVAAAGRKLDLVVYDACLMGEWEVANVTEPFADYMVASPESNYGLMVRSGAWTDWLAGLAAGAETLTPLEVGETLIDNYRATMATDARYVTTIALTDLASVPRLNAAVSGFADALLSAENETFYDALDEVRRGAQQTAYNELVDLRDFARLVTWVDAVPADVATAAAALDAQLDRSILHGYSNVDLAGWSPYYGSAGLAGHNGLTVYLPGRYYRLDEQYAGSGAVWNDRATWDEFLAGFLTGGYAACAGASPVLDYAGEAVGATLGITACCGSRYLLQSFRAPGRELHGVRVAVRKVSGDGGEHQGFYFALYRPGHGFVWGPAHWSIAPNEGEPQFLCLARMGLPTEPGEELQIVVGGGDPYPGATSTFSTPIQWPIVYAASAAAEPPYADGRALVLEGDGAAVTVGEFNGDGIEGTFWFEVY